MTGVRIPADLAKRLNAWIDRQPDPKPTRAEAIRRLMERGLREGD
jgi:metal-responsive CopG/Arc/MetJ family transcriptional regulator